MSEINIDEDLEAFISYQKEMKPKELNPWEASDNEDEQQIVREFEGEILKQYIYRFKQGGRYVTSISYAGIKAIVTSLGNMSITSYNISSDEHYYYAEVQIRDTNRNLDGLGVAECEKSKVFARRITLSKALRNAYRSIIDEALIVKMIDKWELLR